MRDKNILFLAIILMASLVLNLLGINWGVPDKAKINLVFKDKKTLGFLIPEMIKTREEVREMATSYGTGYAPDYDDKQLIAVKTDGNDLVLSKGVLNAMRTFLLRTYYPDEHMVLVALSGMNLKEKDFNPHQFSYGGSYTYTVGFVFALSHLFHFAQAGKSAAYYFLNPDRLGVFYVIGRLVGVTATLFGIYLLFLLGKRYFNERIGLIAASFYGFAPLIVIRNHYFSPYTFALFFVIATFFASLKLITKNDWKYYLSAGVTTGVAAGAISFYGMSGILFVLAGLLYQMSNKGTPGIKRAVFIRILGAGLLAVGVFFITNPYLFVSWGEFIKEMQFGRQDFVFSPSLRIYLFGSLKTALGWLFLMSSLSGLLVAFAGNRKRGNLLLGLSFIICVIFFSLFSPWYARRSIFLVPFFALLSGIFFDYLMGKPKFKTLGGFLLVLVLSYTFLYSLSYDKIFRQKNIRDEAGGWINASLPEGDSVGLVQMPAPYRTPPFAFYRYKLIPVGLDRDLLKKKKPAYLILSEYDLLGAKEETLDNFTADYILLKKFEKPAQILGLKFNRTGFFPKDWWQPNPYILVFKRKN
ncbi:MAG: glycosyltransferase family 39 protein [Candidatus Ratteibacteria bacterium]|jgi:hypothetical protein